MVETGQSTIDKSYDPGTIDGDNSFNSAVWRRSTSISESVARAVGVESPAHASRLLNDVFARTGNRPTPLAFPNGYLVRVQIVSSGQRRFLGVRRMTRTVKLFIRKPNEKEEEIHDIYLPVVPEYDAAMIDAKDHHRVFGTTIPEFGLRAATLPSDIEMDEGVVLLEYGEIDNPVSNCHETLTAMSEVSRRKSMSAAALLGEESSSSSSRVDDGTRRTALLHVSRTDATWDVCLFLATYGVLPDRRVGLVTEEDVPPVPATETTDRFCIGESDSRFIHVVVDHFPNIERFSVRGFALCAKSV